MTDNNDTLGLSRRRVLAGIGAVGVASAGAGLGTTAYFSDSESFEGNTITAGELDLSVTWQQLYYGAPQSTRPGDYGSAERPFVNAYPDSDGNGLQSFEREEDDETFVDQYAELDGSEDDEDREEAAKEGRNLEFACDEIATFEDPSFAPNDESLIELDDVKPGDCGEVTFGLKLCDNPGYIWLQGELASESDGGHPESDGPELADEILASAWYDLDGDNVYDEGEPQIVAGTLRDVLEALNDGELLTYLPEEGTPGPQVSASDVSVVDECIELTKIDDDNIGEYVSGLDDPNDLEGGEEFVFSDEGPDGADVEITIEDVILEDGDVIGFDWSSNVGICQLEMKGGNDSLTTTYVCDTSGTAFTPENDRNPNRLRFGLSNFTFYRCDVADDDGNDVPIEGNGDVCFQPSNTRFIGFEWCLPTSVGNEVQGDSLSFDLSFYTEQCRHNPDPANPFGQE